MSKLVRDILVEDLNGQEDFERGVELMIMVTIFAAKQLHKEGKCPVGEELKIKRRQER